ERLVIANRVRGPSPRVAGRVSELDRKVDRDGLAPVALTREDPVAETVADRAAAAAERLESADDRALDLGRRQAVELAAADVNAVVDIRGLERVVHSPVRPRAEPASPACASAHARARARRRSCR